jgi:hypothetical protein
MNWLVPRTPDDDALEIINSSSAASSRRKACRSCCSCSWCCRLHDDEVSLQSASSSFHLIIMASGIAGGAGVEKDVIFQSTGNGSRSLFSVKYQYSTLTLTTHDISTRTYTFTCKILWPHSTDKTKVIRTVMRHKKTDPGLSEGHVRCPDVPCDRDLDALLSVYMLGGV